MDSQFINHVIGNKVDEIDEDVIFPITYDDEKVVDDFIDEIENLEITSASNFTILSESDVKQLQEASITEISTLLSIPRAVACLLLFHFDWSVTKVHEAWFDDEEKVRKAVGLKQQPQVCFSDFEILTCEICFETFTCNMMKSAGCEHPFCLNCWKRYIDRKIYEGADKCLALKCMNPSCNASVDSDMIYQITSEVNKQKYDRFSFRSFVEKSKNMKWCPGPNCNFAVVYEPDGSNKNLDVKCLCYHSFCWNCGEDAHSPLDCETVNQWGNKLYSLPENIGWFLSYAKPCPRCKITIEKTKQCIECKCGFQFCCLCLRDWKRCCFEGCKGTQVNNFEEQGVEIDKNGEVKYVADKYIHYYDHWAMNEFLRRKAFENLSAEHAKRLSELQGKLECNLEFINEAWLQLVECRRVLKWTYAYGYFLPENEKAKKELLEYTQGEADASLEKFHHYLESKLHEFLNGEALDGFNEFRFKIINLTNAARNYFDGLVRALENGLVDVKGFSNMSESSNQEGFQKNNQH
ncbi:hypothetical protein RIF29_26422 [Crotalaria pallida]|uniref:RBR-type E3 ubiquitin transferase n=1 Tax=Crotalaria pallida TaxID=3830 RepID=A0AAN9ENN0_CROPI